MVFRDIDGVKNEPIELVTADIEEQHQGGVMQALGERKGELVNMEPDGRGRVRLEYRIPARGLIGFTNEFLNLTRGSGLISNIFDSNFSYGTFLLCTESLSPPGHVWIPMFRRSSGEKRSNT